ncbi:hypothetical protein EDD29_0118 [Actinocorallia herbida]|uniref:Uncharacterized protein n=1 Tax=Actinocorallia herbida TaxID=58109 RepID=A0A3N1CMV0_9ACTN|nr:hypothetical protein [Actinocorallia herbida]ROO82637.1 hypothetical protein EDD29_0118 [Actinocorallia herbida]
MKDTCDRCDQPHPRCNAHAEGGTRPCMRWPRKGSAVCPRHGGKAPQTVAAATKRREAAELEEAVTTYGLPRKVGAAEALLEELYRTAGVVSYLEAEIRELGGEGLIWGKVEETDAPLTEYGGGTQTKYAAVPHVLVQLYQRERAHYAKVAKDCLTAGVDKSIIDVYEQVGASYVAMFARVLDQLGLTPEQRSKVRPVLLAELQAIRAGAEAQ